MADRGIPSKMSLMKHPIHPMLVDFPIAFLLLALLTDFAMWRAVEEVDKLFWGRFSGWLIGLGLLAGIAAAVVGAIDFFALPEGNAKKTGWSHFIIMDIALAVALLNGMLRYISLTGYATFGLILSVVTAVLLTAGGWYGGELSFRHGVGNIQD